MIFICINGVPSQSSFWTKQAQLPQPILVRKILPVCSGLSVVSGNISIARKELVENEEQFFIMGGNANYIYQELCSAKKFLPNTVDAKELLPVII